MCRAGSDDPANSELIVYLRAEASQLGHEVDIMKSELAPIMRSAGYRVEWRGSDSQPETTPATLIVLHLQGACNVAAGNPAFDSALAESNALASTAVSDGVVLPFSTINCAALARVVWPVLSQEAAARRDFLYGRAMARVFAHELYHILANTVDHEREGIAKSHFTNNDLLTERFEFEHTTLSKLLHSVPATEMVSEAPSGR